MTFSTKIVSRLMQWIHVQVAISHDKLSSTKVHRLQLWSTNFLKASGKHLDNSCHEFPATRKLPNQPVSRFPINRKVRSKTPAAYLALMMRHKKFLDVSSLFPLLGFPGVPQVFQFPLIDFFSGIRFPKHQDARLTGPWILESDVKRGFKGVPRVGGLSGTFTSALSALNYIYKYKIIGVVVMLFASASSSSSSSSSSSTSSSSSSSSVLGSKLQLLPHARGWSI